MSYPIVLSVVAVEALNLVLLWIALRARISRLARPLVACSGLSGAFGAWVLVVVVHGPMWMMAFTGSVFVLSSVAMGIAIHLATCEEDRQDGGTGGAPSLTPEAPDGGGDDEPLWWPEFERQVAAYAARRSRQRQSVDC
jgi:Ni/Fe-hydrogenase subunit HybB-like protein